MNQTSPVIDESARIRIDELLARLEQEWDIRILYACESGSRAWGFASPDSDYDIRFIYVKPGYRYLSVFEAKDTIELPLDGDLDPGGWDVRKALALLGKSNGALMEWLHSPILYRAADDFLTEWRSLAREVFSPSQAVGHYRGLAKQMWHGKLVGDMVRAKDYLYALRAMFCCHWIEQGRGIPPVAFQELWPAAPPDIIALLPGLLELKERTLESDRMPRIPEIDAFLEQSLGETTRQAGCPLSQEEMAARLDRQFRREMGRTRAEFSDAYHLQSVRSRDLLLFESVAGSIAYGTNLPGSDQDLRGVFVARRGLLHGLDQIEQVTDERNDQVYYELGRFMALLLKNNPNVLELIAMPDDCIRYRHPLFRRLEPSLFLSKLCARTYGDYAMTQIRKAKGLNKKIFNPEPEKRLPMLAFCHVPVGQGSVPLLEWLEGQGLRQQDCGFTAVRNAAGLLALYHDRPGVFQGLVSRKNPDDLVFSSVPMEAQPLTWVSWNQDAFRAHCKAHREYWEWVKERNEQRYLTNAGHGRGYDSKNLMHTIRLLEMAGEIAREGELRVRRPNRDFLLRIRSGDFSYDACVAMAEERHEAMLADFETSRLPDAPDRARVNQLLVEIRDEFGR
jgi:predicted nucleotidyltransferase